MTAEGFSGRGRPTSSASPTASSTTGPAPTSCGRRWPTRRAAVAAQLLLPRPLELKAIKNLLDAGIKLESVRDAFGYLRDLGEDVTTAHLVIAAIARCSCTTARAHRLCSRPRPGCAQHACPRRRQRRGRRRHHRAASARRRARARRPTRRSPPGRFPEVTLRTSPLDAAHRALGAKMVPFGGWDMPLQYGAAPWPSTGPAGRGGGRFDVSHLGTVRVAGPGVARHAAGHAHQRPRQDPPGRAQYTHLLDDADASVLDDIIVWWIADEVFDVMPNASNTDRVVGAPSAARTSPPAGRSSPCRARRPAPAWPRRARGRSDRPVPRRATARWPAPSARWPAPGYTGEDGVELRYPADAPRCVGRGARRRHRARRPRRPRHAAPRGRPAVARPRARPGHHPAPGRSRLGRGLGQGPLPGPRRAGRRARAGVARRLRGSSSRAGARRGPSRPCSSTATRSAWSPAATSRRCSTTASPWPSCRRTWRRAPRWPSTSGAAPAGDASCPPRSSPGR